MKYCVAFIFVLTLLAGVPAIAQDNKPQDISGDWYGVLDIGQKIRQHIVLQKQSDTSYSGQYFSPDKMSAGLPLTRAALHGDTLFLEIAAARASFKGIWDYRASAYIGSFKQNEMSLPLGFSRNATTAREIAPNRPQNPQPPFNYLSQEVLIPNDSARITLAGTFTRPNRNKRYPVVILISGSGPQDRDGTVMGHKPFWIIADQLTRDGVAVLRYDDRGTGASTGTYATAGIADFAGDVKAAIAYLRSRPDVDVNHIGLLGHSEGGNILQAVAADNPQVAFAIALCSPGVKGEDMMLKQNELVYRSLGAPDSVIRQKVSNVKVLFDAALKDMDKNALQQELTAEAKRQYAAFSAAEKANMPETRYVATVVASVTNPEMLSILRFDPADYLPRIHCPVLAI
ncbi:MAG TPA: alpha/beta fold hydrolase, partial [Chitinophaga sp.]